MAALLAHAPSDYTGALQQLLPPGPALPRDTDTTLYALLDALAQELARVDARALDLIDELDPRTTLELLPDWESICGLPDSCSGAIAVTVPERRAAILAKLTAQAAQTPAWLVQLAATLGYAVVITEYTTLRSGFRANDRCNSTDWAFAFTVEVLASGDSPDGTLADAGPAEIIFRAGSRAGDRLRSFGSGALTCVINRARPAHTTPIFAYPAAPVAAWSIDFTQG